MIKEVLGRYTVCEPIVMIKEVLGRYTICEPIVMIKKVLGRYTVCEPIVMIKEVLGRYMWSSDFSFLCHKTWDVCLMKTFFNLTLGNFR